MVNKQLGPNLILQNCSQFKAYDRDNFKRATVLHVQDFAYMTRIYLGQWFFYKNFLVFVTFVCSAWSFGFYIPATMANNLRFWRISIPDLIHYIIFLSFFLRKSQYFPFQCWVLNKGTTGIIFITSLVWRGPWLGIEPGTSRTRSQHSTTRLSRRWWAMIKIKAII